jgi:hypothetical protein
MFSFSNPIEVDKSFTTFLIPSSIMGMGDDDMGARIIHATSQYYGLLQHK